MIELFQNTNLPPKILQQMPTIMTSGGIIIIFVVVVIVCRRVGPAKFLRMYNLDCPPFARGTRHGLHDGGERASAELVRHIVVRVDAGELVWRQVSIDISKIFERVLLL